MLVIYIIERMREKMDIGNRIYTNIRRANKEMVEKFRGIPSSNVGDMMNRLYNMQSYMKCYSKSRMMLGTAFTVKVPDGDNAFLHRAMDLCEPGDVIVVDGNGCETRALMGEMMLTLSEQMGIEGFVVDGAVRDVDCLEHLDISLYARAVTPLGPYKNGPGEINVPVSCGGKVVFPGDIIIGDGDGICIVPKDEAWKVADLARNKVNGELATLEKYKRGEWSREVHGKKYVEVCEKIGTTTYLDQPNW